MLIDEFHIVLTNSVQHRFAGILNVEFLVHGFCLALR
jgi:hypothetical protein